MPLFLIIINAAWLSQTCSRACVGFHPPLIHAMYSDFMVESLTQANLFSTPRYGLRPSLSTDNIHTVLWIFYHLYITCKIRATTQYPSSNPILLNTLIYNLLVLWLWPIIRFMASR